MGEPFLTAGNTAEKHHNQCAHTKSVPVKRGGGGEGEGGGGREGGREVEQIPLSKSENP